MKRDSNSCLLLLSLSPGALFTPSSLSLWFQFDCPHLRQAHMEPAEIIPKPFDDAILVEYAWFPLMMCVAECFWGAREARGRYTNFGRFLSLCLE